VSIFGAMNVSASGLAAERVRMDVAAENLANANSTGGPDGAYRRKEVALRTAGGASFAAALSTAAGTTGATSAASAGAGRVEVAGIVEDQTPNRRVYDPGHPDADAAGYVEMPNVNTVVEMTDLISASRAYEANVTAMQTSKQMFSRVMDLLR